LRRIAAIGLAGGLVSGLLGVGGGVLMVPLLVLLAGYTQRMAHAISLGAIVVIGIAGVATYAIAGKIDYGLAAALAVGAVVGAPIGATLLTTAPEYALKLAFGLCLLAVSIVLVVTN
jgi:uncharacterized membrane protein YfcA